jgi:hypothetical protein
VITAIVRFWFIRQRSSGFYLPHYPTCGITHHKPEDASKVRPRAFTREEDATNALGMWLLGKVYQRPGSSPITMPLDECFDIQLRPERMAMRDDMEVIMREIEL